MKKLLFLALLLAALACAAKIEIQNTTWDTVFTVAGLKRVSEEKFSGYLRPQKPGEVSIVLFTADGRKWRAKWEEIKP